MNNDSLLLALNKLDEGVGISAGYQLLDQLPEAVLLVRREPEEIVLANSRAKVLLRLKDDMPVPLSELTRGIQHWTSESRPIAHEELPLVRAVRAGEAAASREIQLVRPDGRRGIFLVNTTPVRDERGQTSGAISVFHDITEIRDAEQLKDDFLTLAAHELRTPLTAIHGNAHVLLHDEDRLPANTRSELLEDIVIASRRLADVVENLAQVASIRAGRFVVAPEPVAIVPLVERTISGIRAGEPNRSISVVVAEQLVVLGDPHRIDQVLRNLLHNALKYSPGGTTIDVSVRQNGEMVSICVRDHGPGFSDELLSRVFEWSPGDRRSSSSNHSGMGLGLYLSRQIIEAQGGRIWIEAPAGGGARLCFTLPQLTDG